jgi:hypothetical protein
MNWVSPKSVLPSDTDLNRYVDTFVEQLIEDGPTSDRQFNCAMCEAIQDIINICKPKQNYYDYYDFYKSLKNDTNKGLLKSLVPTFFTYTSKIGTTVISETSDDYQKVFNMIIERYKTAEKPGPKTKLDSSKFNSNFNDNAPVIASTPAGPGIPAGTGGRKRSRRHRIGKKSKRSKKGKKSRRSRKY